MSITKIKIEEFIQLSRQYPVLDVRSPEEFKHAHIPGAFSLPLFSDEERKIVGTAYKQQSREIAIKIGLDFFGLKMRKMVEEVEQIVNNYKSPSYFESEGVRPSLLLHCWRGGMRSAGVAWLLDLYGFKVYTLSGGYKSFRNWTFAQFEKPYPFNIIGGYTGSGKTFLLNELVKNGHFVIDLEHIAKHKGSAFGDDDTNPQPRQEMFENELAIVLNDVFHKLQNRNNKFVDKPIWLEDESQRIGQLNIPAALWKNMRSSPVYFMDIPFEERLENITQEYGLLDKAKLINAIIRIQKRLGGLDTKMTINHLLEDKHKEAFSILLKYYDKHYSKSLQNRENLTSLLHTITCEKVNSKVNMQKILNEKIIA